MPAIPLLRALALGFTILSTTLHAQVPQILNYQGNIAVGTPPVNFNGSGVFRFALVNTDGTTTFWSNDGTSTAGSQPTAGVTLAVAKGLYSVLLGDTAERNLLSGIGDGEGGVGHGEVGWVGVWPLVATKLSGRKMVQLRPRSLPSLVRLK